MLLSIEHGKWCQLSRPYLLGPERLHRLRLPPLLHYGLAALSQGLDGLATHAQSADVTQHGRFCWGRQVNFPSWGAFSFILKASKGQVCGLVQNLMILGILRMVWNVRWTMHLEARNYTAFIFARLKNVLTPRRNSAVPHRCRCRFPPPAPRC